MNKRGGAVWELEKAVEGLDYNIQVQERELLREQRLPYIQAYKKSLGSLREERERVVRKLNKMKGK